MRKKSSTITVCLLLVMMGMVAICCSDESASPDDFQIPQILTDQVLQVSIESAVGSFERLRYNVRDGHLDTVHQSNLPLPLSSGFLLSEKAGQPMKTNVWVIGKNMSTGDTLSVDPIAIINYDMEGESFRDIVAVPKNPRFITIRVQKFRDFLIKFDPVKFNFEYWLRQHRRPGALTQLFWEDEEKARAFLTNLTNQ